MAAMTEVEAEKQRAAVVAVDRVRPGMVLALGTGSTAAYAVRALAARLPELASLVTVASSRATEDLARNLGLRVRDLEADEEFDLMIDGADEVGPHLELTKGGGGAMFREKFLARLSKEIVIVVDHTKLVDHLGSRVPIPIEVVPFARPVIIRQLARRGLAARSRMGGTEVVRTDNGNEILDLFPFPPLTDPKALDRELRDIPGVVETGIFIDLADRVLVGLTDGSVREILPSSPRTRSG
ncbi:MAG: ribose-5-phosphate isomerase RpiA [Thermoplasmata archaeon]